MVIDCTPSGVGTQNKTEYYERFTSNTKGFIAQGSEFGFALLAVAITSGLLSLDLSQPIIAAIILSMAISPFNAFMILQGLSTLPLRMERHCENTQKVAEYLQQHPKVEWVSYAGLPDSPYHVVCQKTTGGKASGILSFGIKGGKEAGARFIDALQMILRLVNIGDAKSLACHPATTTHRQLGPKELASAGVSEDMVRLSIGIEHVDDIIADIDQALVAAG